MTKSVEVRARIEPEVKARAEAILARHGITHSAFISMAYHAVLNQGGVPLSFNEPNRQLAQDLRQGDRELTDGKLARFPDAGATFDHILKDDA